MSVGRLVAAIPDVVAKGRRDWLHIGHVACLLVMQMQFWWRMWNFESIEQWDFLGYFFLMSVPLVYYLATHILVPANSGEVPDWRAHFEDSGKWFYATVAAAWSSGALVSNYLFKFLFIPPPMVITVVLFVTGMFVKHRIYHVVVLIWWMMVLGAVTYNLQMGGG